MKCYFALNNRMDLRPEYLDMLRVAIKSARKNTTLDLCCIYDGKETDEAYKIMQEYNVKITVHTVGFKEDLRATYSDDYIKNKCNGIEKFEDMLGTFTRMDIPLIEQEDEYVLFTDIDVIFLKDIKEEELPKPKYCAAAPEICQDFDIKTHGYKFFNAGVMYLNVKNMREKYQGFLDMLKNRQHSKIECLDQGYLNHLCGDVFDELGLEYNWKTYWGINKDAKIVHMHAAKPNGEYAPSGFYNIILSVFPDCIKGAAYYYQLFFEFLGKNSPLWLAEHIDFLVNQKINRHKRRLKKILILAGVGFAIGATLFLLLLFYCII